MNAKVVASSSENVLRTLLKGQSADLVAKLTRNLRIRQALQWTGPDASRAPFVVHRTALDGGKSMALTNDLLAERKIRWDPDEVAFVSESDDLTTYTIPSDDDELPEVLNDEDVPPEIRDSLRMYLTQTDPNVLVHPQIPNLLPFSPDCGDRQPSMSPGQEHGLFSPPPSIPMGGSGPYVISMAQALAIPSQWGAWAACDDSQVVRLLDAADGHEIGRVHHRKGDDQCTIELSPPLPGGGKPSEIVLIVAGRPIEPVGPFDKYGSVCVRYADIKDVIDGKEKLSFSKR